MPWRREVLDGSAQRPGDAGPQCWHASSIRVCTARHSVPCPCCNLRQFSQLRSNGAHTLCRTVSLVFIAFAMHSTVPDAGSSSSTHLRCTGVVAARLQSRRAVA